MPPSSGETGRLPSEYLRRLSLKFPSYATFNVEFQGMLRSNDALHLSVDGIWRLGSGSVSVTRPACCGPGSKTKPRLGSARLRMFGVVLNVRSAALGGLKRTFAPDCEKIDWKMRPS